jgi:hypothetical protein
MLKLGQYVRRSLGRFDFTARRLGFFPEKQRGYGFFGALRRVRGDYLIRQ